MTDLGERLKHARKLAKFEQPDLANILGVASSTYSRYERGKNVPDADFLISFCNQLKINPNWLLFGWGPISITYDFSEAPINDLKSLPLVDYINIPLLEGQVTAGPDGGIIYDHIKDRYPFKREWIEKKFGSAPDRLKKLVLTRISGDSMCPLITSGELVLVDTLEDDRVNVRNGRVYLVRLPDGTLALKRLSLLKIDGILKLLLLSDNPAYEPFEFEVSFGRSLTYYILGRIRWVGRELE